MVSHGSSLSGATSHSPFASTQWRVVLDARDHETRRRDALEQLCRTYWPPVYSYLRRRGKSPADAADTTQAFFAHLLSGDFLSRPDPARGRFRGYLVGALRQFVAHQHEHMSAVKRGGRIEFVALDEFEPDSEFTAVAHPDLDPSQAYELSWAFTVLGHAMRRVESEQLAAGRGAVFAALKPFLHTPPSAGDYQRVAEILHTSRATVAVWLHRLTHRLAEVVKLEVASTLDNPTDAEQELRHLLQVFRR